MFWFVGFSIGHAPVVAGIGDPGRVRRPRGTGVIDPGYNFGVQLRHDPIHLRPICRRLFRNHDVAAVRQQIPKAVEHLIAPADNVATKTRIGLVQPAGEADPAGHRIDLSHRITRVGQDQVRANHQGHVLAKLFLARELDQLRRFSRIEILRDPRWLFAFDAALIQLIAGALENVKTMTKLLQLVREFLIDRKRIRRKQKILLGEETVGRKGCAYVRDIHQVKVFKSSKFQAPSSRETSNSKHQNASSRLWSLIVGASLELGAWNLELYLPAAIFFSALFTSSWAVVIPGSRSCKSRTVLCASTCL